MIIKIWSTISKPEQVSLTLILLYAVMLSIIESVGVAAIMPFISVASDPSLLITNHALHAVYVFFGYHNSVSFTIAFGCGLILIYIFRSVNGLIYIYLSNKFLQNVYLKTSYKIFEKYLRISYKEFVCRNNSALLHDVRDITRHMIDTMQAVIGLIAESFIFMLLCIFLLLFNLKLTIVLAIILGIIVLVLNAISTKILKNIGARRNNIEKKIHKVVVEAFANFKMIKLRANQKAILETFNDLGIDSTKITTLSLTLQQYPRLLLEGLGFSILIGVVIYVLYAYKDVAMIIPVISMYALVLYRILPSINRILFSYHQIIFYKSSLDTIKEALNTETEEEFERKIFFEDQIKLKNVAFVYKNNNVYIFKKINLVIHKGDRIAVIGESGSGKSTLIDLIIGIYKPANGEILIDSTVLNYENIKSWRKKIGYIPQSIYLFDGTVAENISYGNKFNKDKIIECLKQANIYDFLLDKQGLDTKVGDGGIQLSGGQKQRIGIARALYTHPEILILDEATSALDDETEAKIMDEIYNISKDKTLIIVAHRLSTIALCERVIHIDKGGNIKEYSV